MVDEVKRKFEYTEEMLNNSAGNNLLKKLAWKSSFVG